MTFKTRFQVTKVSKAAKKYSADHPDQNVWYFRQGNNEGFIAQFKQPSLSQMGFHDFNGRILAMYNTGRKII